MLLNSFHLNGHTLGFHPQTQKLKPHLLTQGLTLGAKGLKWVKMCFGETHFASTADILGHIRVAFCLGLKRVPVHNLCYGN